MASDIGQLLAQLQSSSQAPQQTQLGQLLAQQKQSPGAGGEVTSRREADSPIKGQENKNGWMRVLQDLRDDPNKRQALMAAGAAMMRTPQPGQARQDQMANAIQAGLQTFTQLEAREEQQNIQRERLEQQERQANQQAKLGQQRVNLQREQFEANAPLREARETMLNAQARLQDLQADRIEESGTNAGADSTETERATDNLTQILMRSMPDQFPNEDSARAAAMEMTGLAEGRDRLGIVTDMFSNLDPVMLTMLGQQHENGMEGALADVTQMMDQLARNLGEDNGIIGLADVSRRAAERGQSGPTSPEDIEVGDTLQDEAGNQFTIRNIDENAGTARLEGPQGVMLDVPLQQLLGPQRSNEEEEQRSGSNRLRGQNNPGGG